MKILRLDYHNKLKLISSLVKKTSTLLVEVFFHVIVTLSYRKQKNQIGIAVLFCFALEQSIRGQ